MGTKHIAAIVGLALVATAGIATATYAGQSIWGGNNPGQGADHANMPEAAAEHNRAGAEHPTPEPGAGNGDDNGAGDDGTNEGSQPEDVPPAHATDGEPEDGQPDDVPPAHSAADEHAQNDA